MTGRHAVSPLASDHGGSRRRPLRRRSNRRVAVQRRSLLVGLADGIGAAGRLAFRLAKMVGKALVLLGTLAATAWGAHWAVAHVLASPRFALRTIAINPTIHLRADEVLELARIHLGEQLLALDTDRAALLIAGHPWVAGVRVSRQLPSGLDIAITERQAAAVVSMGGLYLVEESGRPFKRATIDEAEGLIVITGIDRARFVGARPASEAAFREALAVLAIYQRGPSRPVLSEINIDPHFGFTLVLFDNGAEIRLGRGEYDKKLARLDQIFEAVRVTGATDGHSREAIRVVHLDDVKTTRVPVRFAAAAPQN